LSEVDPGVGDGRTGSIENAAAEDSGDLGIGGGCAGESTSEDHERGAAKLHQQGLLNCFEAIGNGWQGFLELSR
jgi:hypothetical protein